jgi:hypothetical protein
MRSGPHSFAWFEWRRQYVRKLALVLLLGCLAFGAWWTATPRTAEQTVGWCVQQRGQEFRFVRCGARLPAGFVARGEVAGVSPQLIDTVGEPPFGPFCPPETDDMVRAQLPQGRKALLCLDTTPGDGNVRARR